MTDIREALVALLCQEDHAPLSEHDPDDGSCLSCPWPLHEMPPEVIADAILVEFDVTERAPMDSGFEDQNANYLRMKLERDALRAEVERLREDYQAACEARMAFHDELDAAQRQVADLRAEVERLRREVAAGIETERGSNTTARHLLAEARQQVADLRAGIEALADTKPGATGRALRALLAGSGEQSDDEGVTVEWGVGYGDQRIATESREEAEEWIADEDAWYTGEKRWLIMRQVGPWTRAEEEEDDD